MERSKAEGIEVRLEEVVDLSSWEVGASVNDPPSRWRLDGDGWMRIDRKDGTFARCRVGPPKCGPEPS